MQETTCQLGFYPPILGDSSTNPLVVHDFFIDLSKLVNDSRVSEVSPFIIRCHKVNRLLVKRMTVGQAGNESLHHPIWLVLYKSLD